MISDFLLCPRHFKCYYMTTDSTCIFYFTRFTLFNFSVQVLVYVVGAVIPMAI